MTSHIEEHLRGPNPLRVNPDQLLRVYEWLTTVLPGGQHIWPHWQDGPYYVVGVLSGAEPNWQAQVILDACPRVIRLPAWDGDIVTVMDVHVVSDFGARTLRWHEAEYEMALREDDLMDPSPTPRSDEDLLKDLGGLFLPDQLRAPLAREIDILTNAGASGLDALTTVTTSVMHHHQVRVPDDLYMEFPNTDPAAVQAVHVVRVAAAMVAKP